MRPSWRDPIIAGFALFAMFFGAGNLIFPPLLGQEAGDQWLVAFFGFVAVDALLACLGIYAINAAGGPWKAIDGALGRYGGIVLNAAAIICLCVLFAMPRTAATSFEISVAPYFGDHAAQYLLPFSIVFFVIVFALALRESRLVDIIGRFFTPTLVVGTLIVIVVGTLHPLGAQAAPTIDNVVQTGVRSGYQTMDVLGVVSFSIILLNSKIIAKYRTSQQKTSVIARSAVTAALLLTAVYGGLAYVGSTSSSLGTDLNQVQLVLALVQALLGDFGVVLLGLVVLLACFTTAVALVSSAAAFFHRLLGGRVSYTVLLAADCIIGVLICNLGLDAIIALADPVLGVVYPPLLTVVVLLLFHKRIGSQRIYQGAAIGACLSSLVFELAVGFGGDAALAVLESVPLYSYGFGWVTFAVIGGIIGWLASRGAHAEKVKEEAKSASSSQAGMRSMGKGCEVYHG